MAQLESLSQSILRDRELRGKWLLGGLLLSLPLLNLLVLGYWLRYLRRQAVGRGPMLPAWQGWEELLVDSVRMLGIKLAFGVLPVLVGGLLSLLLAGLFHLLMLDLLAWTIAWVPAMAALAISPVLFLAAAYAFVRTGDDWRVLLQTHVILGLVQRSVPKLIAPTLAFWGLAALGWPLLGFLIFLGFSILISYYFHVFSQVWE
ncbi:MAG: DUF4013 domain-containing protein [Verrucomicrobiota bacterium JB022]|nr:DUF4013 domain-containing protein [Verrucomicrobiota bacterium JB022]